MKIKHFLTHSIIVSLFLIATNGLSAQIIADGTYQIYSDVHQEAMVSATTGDFDVSMTTPDFSDNNQLWNFTHQGGNIYKISNVASGSFIGIKDGWCGQFGDVQARYAVSDANVEFLVSEGNNPGTYVLQIAFTTCNFGSVNNPVRAFDIQDGASSAQIQTFDVDSSGANQQFRIVSHVWNGTPGSTDWATASNWTPTTLPTSSSNVRITGTTNQPTISTSVVVNDLSTDIGSFTVLNKDLTIEGDFSNLGIFVANSGSSLITKKAVTGQITYNLQIPDTNWHLVSSPVVGETYNDAWVLDNDIASGITNTSNRAISTYVNSTDLDGDWVYFQGGEAETTFGSGTGYSMLRNSVGPFAFIGNLATETVNTTITQTEIGVATGIFNKWNLVGNPFPSYINIADFLTANEAALTDANEAVYIWNGTEYTEQTTGYIHPGQAFFVNSDALSTSINVTEAMLSPQTGVAFLKANNPSVTVFVESENNLKSTKINYLENKTKGLDPRFDVGSFTGSSNSVKGSLDIFTQLLESNEGVNFMRQTLPNKDLETMVVPLVLRADAGKEIKFTVNAQNLPTGIKVYLEDRLENKFISLEEADKAYTVTLNNASNSSGRFYVHTTSNASLSINRETLSNVSLYKINNSTLRIVGLTKGNTNLKLFNILGKQMISSSFEANGLKEISLPNLATGVYLVQLETENGKLNKKIILE